MASCTVQFVFWVKILKLCTLVAAGYLSLLVKKSLIIRVYTPGFGGPTGFVGPHTHGCSEDTVRVPPAPKNKSNTVSYGLASVQQALLLL